jgi:hypothetical protein
MALGEGVGMALGDGLDEGVGMALGDGLDEGVGMALGDGLGEGVGMALGDGLGEGVGMELGAELGTCVAVADGDPMTTATGWCGELGLLKKLGFTRSPTTNMAMTRGTATTETYARVAAVILHVTPER